MDFDTKDLDYNLAKEFNTQVFVHKSSIVLGALLKFYSDYSSTGTTLPDCFKGSPEEQAKEHYYNLLADRDMFNIMYDRCWERYAEVLP